MLWRRFLAPLAYAVVVTPYGLVRRLTRDPLARRWKPEASTYFVWTDPSTEPPAPVPHTEIDRMKRYRARGG
jgi:hypothetical protein